MFRSTCAVVLAGLLTAVFALPNAAEAGGRKAKNDEVVTSGGHPKSNYYRGTKVRGYAARRGGYSYNYAESVNTYGDARSNYGAASSLRDPKLDRQTRSGPFDHGFFFDSAVAPRGGDAPYMN
jgi:hypothetical protein